MGTSSVNSILIAGKTRDKLQPWEPKQDKNGWDVDEDGNLKLQKDIDQLFSQFLIFQSYQTFCRIIRWRNNEWISSYETQTSWWLEATTCHKRNLILYSEVLQQLWFWLQPRRFWRRNFGCADQQLTGWLNIIVSFSKNLLVNLWAMIVLSYAMPWLFRSGCTFISSW